MSVSKLAAQLGEAMVKLGFTEILEHKDHLGGLIRGEYNPTGDTYPDRYGFSSTDSVGSLVDKRFRADMLADLLAHKDNPLNVDLGKLSRDKVQSAIEQDLWIGGDFRRFVKKGSNVPAWDDFLVPLHVRLFGAQGPAPKPVDPSPVVVAPQPVAWKRPPLALAGKLEQIVGWPNLNEGQRVYVSKLAVRFANYADAYLAAYPETKITHDDD